MSEISRQDAHCQIDRMFDKLELEGRTPLGLCCAIPHHGVDPESDAPTLETMWFVIRIPKMSTVLLGSLETLKRIVFGYQEHEELNIGPIDRG